MFVINWTRRIYRVLSGDSRPTAVALGAVLGLIAGSVPLTCGLFWLLLLAILIVRVQWSTAVVFWSLGRLIVWSGAVPLYHRVGSSLLYAESLKGFWSSFLDLPGVALLGFDVPAILGGALLSSVIGAILIVPLRMAVIAFRRWAAGPGQESGWWRWLTSFWLARLLRYVFVGSTSSSSSEES